MLVRIMFGASRGEVWDMPPHEASAMLRDGRAVAPDALAPVAPAPTSGVPHTVTDRVVAREDRGMPRGKRRAVR